MNKFTKYLMAFTASAILAGGAYIAVDKIVDKGIKDVQQEQEQSKPLPDDPVAVTFKATFLYGGLEKTQDVVAGEFPKFEAFVHDGFSKFIGWYIDNEDELVDPWTYPMTQDTIFVAKFEKPVNITFEGSEEGQLVYPGDEITIPADPVKEGYTFQGWSLDGINIVDINSVEITEDTVFVAVFKQNTYTITIEIDGETTTQTVNHGDLLSIEDPTKEGYNFIGWTIDGQVIDLETYTFTQDTTLVALFEEATTSASLFSFDESGNVTGYTGEETEILIPKTYSLGEVETVTNSYTTYYTLKSSEKSYPFTVTDSNSQVFEINSYLDLSANRSSIKFPASVTKNIQKFVNGRDYSVTGIKSNAFKSNTTLTSVVIPEGVTTIASNAFNGCTNLTSVEVPDTVTSISATSFNGCTNFKFNKISETDVGNYVGNKDNPYVALLSLDSKTFTTFTIPENCKYIVSSAFNGCTSLTSISIPEGITTLESSTFKGCSALKTIALPSTLTTINRYAFQNCTSLTNISIPDSVTTIGTYLFDGCTSLTSATLPNAITLLPSNTFSNCTALEIVNLPEELTELGSSAFYKCSKLKELTLPTSLTKIGSSCFSNAGITSLIIPDSVTSIGTSAFSTCSSFKTLHLGAGVTDISVFKSVPLRYITVSKNNPVYDSREDCNAIIETATNTMVLGGYNTTFPSSVTTIGSYAFSKRGLSSEIPNTITSIGDCAFMESGISTIVIPDSVTSLGKNIFEITNYLQSVTLPNSITTIPEGMFQGCNVKLTSITIPNSVTTIEKHAFYACSKLQTVIWGTSVTTIGDSAFASTALTSITIPDSVTSVGDSAFNYCSALTTVTLGKGLTSIGTNAFGSCSALAKVHLTCDSVFEKTFGTTTTKFYVPDELYDSYLSSEIWAEKTSQIYKESES